MSCAFARHEHVSFLGGPPASPVSKDHDSAAVSPVLAVPMDREVKRFIQIVCFQGYAD